MNRTCRKHNPSPMFRPDGLNIDPEPAPPDAIALAAILKEARQGKGIPLDSLATLLSLQDPGAWQSIGAAAQHLKDRIFGNRMVLFAPLYLSNVCANDCQYCAFRRNNPAVHRATLSPKELDREVRVLLKQGHKRLLLVSGEAYPKGGFQTILDAIDTVYAANEGGAAIRRINVNLAPLRVEEYRALRDRGIGTFQVFQETYDAQVYAAVHTSGPKANFERRLRAPAEAIAAGLDDVGMGVLLGLSDWRREVLSLVAHAHWLEAHYGVGPHTVSIPRLEPAAGSNLASHPPAPVDDATLLHIVALLRLALPATGIILSTREPAELRTRALALGVSQLSAGSCTMPGGYAQDGGTTAQFALHDHRSLDQVVGQLAGDGYLPSFCTACYRSGRTGQTFMDLARPGGMRGHCNANGLVTFLEYLVDHASTETRAAGYHLIEESLAALPEAEARSISQALAKVRAGVRDLRR